MKERRFVIVLLTGLIAIFLYSLSFAATSASPDQDGAVRLDKSRRITPVVRVYQKASPAVVNISTEKIVEMGGGFFGPEIDPFEDFMSRFFRRRVPAVSLGSGFIFHPDGYIATNDHVVRRARKITVTLADGTDYLADIVAASDVLDLAVLKIRNPKGRKFHYLKLGRSDDLMFGETVVAIGNPFGYQNTCTAGVISALNRKVEFRGVVHKGLIQTDAPINPGNSGGPLLNILGEVIGINTAIRANAQGIGFAIPIDELVSKLPRLLDFERINRVIFGLKVKQIHTDKGEILKVISVEPGTPAEKAGCKKGDILVSLNGKRLTGIQDYLIAMLSAKAGQRVKLSFLRGGNKVEIIVRLLAKPKPDGAVLAWKLFGLKLRTITPALARRLRLPMQQGLLVVQVEPNSPADAIGISVGDVIFQLGKWYVKDLDDVGAVLEDLPAGAGIRIGIARGNVRAWTIIPSRKRIPTGRGRRRIRI